MSDEISSVAAFASLTAAARAIADAHRSGAAACARAACSPHSACWRVLDAAAAGRRRSLSTVAPRGAQPDEEALNEQLHQLRRQIEAGLVIASCLYTLLWTPHSRNPLTGEKNPVRKIQ